MSAALIVWDSHLGTTTNAGAILRMLRPRTIVSLIPVRSVLITLQNPLGKKRLRRPPQQVSWSWVGGMSYVSAPMCTRGITHSWIVSSRADVAARETGAFQPPPISLAMQHVRIFALSCL
jgi:hypothetical protein